MPRYALLYLSGASLTCLVLASEMALACACCSNRASRYVEVEKLDQRLMATLDRFNFARIANLMISEADADPLASDLGSEFTLDVTRTPGEFRFAFKSRLGRIGTLTLAVPRTISIFEVDPRGEEKDEGLGPNLYKEWKLTANAAGDGMFRQAAGPHQKITLIFHGRGRGCTDADHFSDWTLLIHGPGGKLTLYGALEPGKP